MRLLTVIVSSVALGALALPALAQDGKPAQPPPGAGAPPGGAGGERPPRAPRGEGAPPRGDRQAAAPAKAAWELEAKGVAKGLGLSDDLTSKTVAAYTEAQDSYRTASQKARQEAMDKAREKGGEGEGGDDGPGGNRAAMAVEMQKMMNEVRKSEATKLQTKLATIMSADQAAIAIQSLGTFNRSWDNMVNSIIGFNLDDAKKMDSLKPIQAYVIELSKVQQTAGEDREAMQKAIKPLRDKLTDAMKKILSEEQMTKFDRSIGGAGFGGRGGEGGPGTGGGPGGRRGGAGGGNGGPGGTGGGSKP